MTCTVCSAGKRSGIISTSYSDNVVEVAIGPIYYKPHNLTPKSGTAEFERSRTELRLSVNKEALIVKWQTIFIVLILSCVQHAQALDKPSGKTLAASMEVYAFPKTGQTAVQQSQDEASCYEWATSNVGQDPFDLSKQAAQQQAKTDQAKATAQQTGKGSGARGALRGAAAGAIVGEIVDDDAGKGAAIGAGAGAIASRRRARRSQQQAVAQADQQGQAKQEATQKQVDNFKKAFAVCLEAKDYLVKY